MKQPPRRSIIIRLGSLGLAAGAGPWLSACGGGGSGSADTPAAGGSNTTPTPRSLRFDFGVASGDPLADRIILWTHARFADGDDDVDLRWEVAADAAFTSLLASGTAVARAAAGHTVKVDATGLPAGQRVYFRFRQGDVLSPVGRTQTLPAAGATGLDLAVVSCSRYSAGQFRVLAEVTRSAAQFVLHLGDVIYESGADEDLPEAGRPSDPTSRCTTLADYRRRHAQTRSEPDAKVMHAALPVLAIWDDHDIAGNAWRDGADGHDAARDGNWAARVAAATQAWHEWMPIRTPDATDLRRTARSFDFGGLAALHLVETRLLARDAPVSLDALLDPATATATAARLNDGARGMLGSAQRTWLQSQMSASGARWQVLGQSVPMARMTLPVSVLGALAKAGTGLTALFAAKQAVDDYIAARQAAATQPAALTAAQQTLLDPQRNPRWGFNLDAWDGFPAEREALLTAAQQAGKRLVVLAGDSHNAWSSRLTLADGRVVGQEFTTPSVTSPGLERKLAVLPPAQVAQMFLGMLDDLQWAETERRGFLHLRFSPAEVRAQWTFVSSVTAATWQVETSAERVYTG